MGVAAEALRAMGVAAAASKEEEWVEGATVWAAREAVEEGARMAIWARAEGTQEEATVARVAKAAGLVALAATLAAAATAAAAGG